MIPKHLSVSQRHWLALLLAVLLLGAAAAGCAPAAQQTASPAAPQPNQPTFSDCRVRSAGLSTSIAARCTTLLVRENPADASSQQISLNIAVIPAVSRSPEPDPVFFLAGGPGEAATQAYLVVASAFQRVNLKRDIVLVDQRGTGSSNLLECPDSPSPAGEEPAPETTAEEEVQACVAALAGDPRFYTTTIAMQDLEQVRQALGYQQINLVGASYGTRAALVYARLYPQFVRSLVLDGVAPPEWMLGPDMAGDAQRALDLIFARCQADTQCSQAYPDLQAEFDGLLQRLEEAPASVSLPDPLNGEPASADFTASDLKTLTHLLSYTPETVALLPQMIHQAYAWQEYDALASLARQNLRSLNESISTGMRLAVLCSEDAPLWGSATPSQGYLGLEGFQSLQEVCALWPAGEMPAGFHDPVVSAAPTLLISGEADPVTPPRNAELAARSLPNSLQLVLPGHAHINMTRGCLPNLLYEFIASGSTAGLDSTCVQASQPMPFFINLNGPTP